MGRSGHSFDIKGLPELIAELESLPDKTLLNMERRVLREGMKSLLDTAMQKVPVKTGNLKRSFKVRVVKNKSKGVLEGQLINNANHAHLLEFGWIHTGPKPKLVKGEYVPPKPFMRPSLYQNSNKLIEMSSEGFLDLLAKFKAKAKK